MTELFVIDCHVHTLMLRKTLEEESTRGQTETLVEIKEKGRLEGTYAFDSRTHAPLKPRSSTPS